MTKSIEIRCPGKFKKLFLILKQEHMPVAGTYMEIACADCLKLAKVNGSYSATRALHYYDMEGNCVQTKLVDDIRLAADNTKEHK